LLRITQILDFRPSLRELVSLVEGRWIEKGLSDATRALASAAAIPNATSPKPNLRVLADKIPSCRPLVSSLSLSPDTPPASTSSDKSTLAKVYWS
jgi:hypothetical protein